MMTFSLTTKSIRRLVYELAEQNNLKYYFNKKKIKTCGIELATIHKMEEMIIQHLEQLGKRNKF